MTFPNPPHDPKIQQAFTMGTILGRLQAGQGGLGASLMGAGGVNMGGAPFDTPLAEAMREMREQQLKGMGRLKTFKDRYPAGGPLLPAHSTKKHTIDDAIFCEVCIKRRLVAEIVL